MFRHRALLIALFVSTGCGSNPSTDYDAGFDAGVNGGGGTDAGADAGFIPYVAITPSTLAVPPWNQALLTAKVFGTASQGVVWSVVESNGGTVSSSATSVRYFAPGTEGVYTVKATSVGDPSITGTASIVVTSLGRASIRIYPDPVSFNAGVEVSPVGAQTFTALEYMSGVSPTAMAPAVDVQWSVVQGVAGGTVSSSGTYGAPLTPGTYHVFATVPGTPTKSALAEIEVGGTPRSVSVDPAVSTVAPNGTVQLQGQVSGASASLQWSVVGGSARGTVTQTGLYTAPSTPGVYVVRVRENATFTDALATIIVQ